MGKIFPSRGPRRALGGLGSLHRLHWCIVGLSLVVTASAWQVSRGLVAERDAARFDREAGHLIELVTERMSRYEDALQAGVAAIAARGGDIDRDSWRRFAATLQIEERYPGINGIGVVRHVRRDGLDDLLARERASNPGFSVRPEHEQDEHYPIVHVEPEAANRKAIGLDLAHEAHRLEGARRAERTGRPQITGPIVLVQDAGQTPGFLFYAPGPDLHRHEGSAAPREGFDGLVYAPFIVGSLMKGVLAKERRQVWTAISDAGESIYDEHDAAASGHDPDPLFTRTIDVPLYGRTWRFDIRSNLAFREAVAMHMPTVVLLGGISIDLMLIALFVGMSRTNRALTRIADMHADLETKAEALAETNRDLERFACVVSHDLKTPLRGIGDLAWYLEEDLEPYLASPEASPDVARNIGRLHTQVRRMNGLIEGILDYSAAGSHAVRIETVDARAVFEEVADGLELAEGQLLLPDAMPVFESCRTRFAQVVSNIVGNAFKYHPEPKKAIVTVHVTRLDERYRFSIADDGCGIDPRFHDRIFEMFQTLQPQDAMESTGVGLSIVRKSVESVGGAVHVESEPGGGSTFHVDWPVALIAQGGSPTAEEHHSAPAISRRAA